MFMYKQHLGWYKLALVSLLHDTDLSIVALPKVEPKRLPFNLHSAGSRFVSRPEHS
jgi:hypothetical protein